MEAGALIDDALRQLGGGVGIFSEMVDVASGDFLGNIPQGLSHLALIHAVCSLDIDAGRPFPTGAVIPSRAVVDFYLKGVPGLTEQARLTGKAQ